MDWAMVLVSGRLFGLAVAVALAVFLARRLGKAAIPLIAGIAVTMALCDQTASHLIKNLVQRYRPCHDEALSGLLRLVSGCGGKYGFVSSHAANAAGFAAYLTLALDRRFVWIKRAAWFLVAAVCYSRVYLGVHYPSDVFAGSCLGVLIGFLVCRIQFRNRIPDQEIGSHKL